MSVRNGSHLVSPLLIFLVPPRLNSWRSKARKKEFDCTDNRWRAVHAEAIDSDNMDSEEGLETKNEEEGTPVVFKSIESINAIDRGPADVCDFPSKVLTVRLYSSSGCVLEVVEYVEFFIVCITWFDVSLGDAISSLSCLPTKQ